MAEFNIPDELHLVSYDDAVIHTACERFDFVNPQFDIVDFSIKLVKKMQEFNALGLAANQVGVPFRIFAMNAEPALVMINPKIIGVSDEETYINEGCLTYPGLAIKVKRPAVVETRVNHPNGSAKTYKFENLTAHVFLHEYAHLDGRTFLDDTDRFHLEKAKKDIKLLKRKGIL